MEWITIHTDDNSNCRKLYWGKLQNDSPRFENTVSLCDYMWNFALALHRYTAIAGCVRAWKTVLFSTYPIPSQQKVCACALHMRNSMSMKWRVQLFMLQIVEWDETIQTERFIKIIRGRFFSVRVCVCVYYVEHFLRFFSCVLVVLLCCYFCYCNAIIKTIAPPLPNTVCTLWMAVIQTKIYKTLHTASRLWVSVVRSVGRCCWCLVCIAHTYRLSVNKQLASRTDVFFSIPPTLTDTVLPPKSRTLFLFVYFLERTSTVGDLDYDFCQFCRMKILLFHFLIESLQIDFSESFQFYWCACRKCKNKNKQKINKTKQN